MQLRQVLWIDSRAGLAVGIGMLALAPWLSGLYRLPIAFVLAVAVANVAYGTYSYSLWRRPAVSRRALLVLAAANATWAVACFVAAAAVSPTASALGVATLLFEGVFVGALAAIEWRRLDECENPVSESASRPSR